MNLPHKPNFGAQRLYDSVQLVNRVGNRSQKQLCVMSLVALMAGERHTDRPDCACAVITAYAIKLNDALDDETRQRLKPFAPRIIGTRDGYEAERAHFLVTNILRDVVPREMSSHGVRQAAHPAGLRLPVNLPPREAARQVQTAIRHAVQNGLLSHGRAADLRYLIRAYARGSHELVATASAVLLANNARLAESTTESRWYWNYATDLLDRTCDVGISATRSTADVERMSQLAAAELQASVLKACLRMPSRRKLASIFHLDTD